LISGFGIKAHYSGMTNWIEGLPCVINQIFLNIKQSGGISQRCADITIQLLEIVDIVGAGLFYRAHFSSWKEQIRNWMQIWYLSQKSELREIDQYDLVLIKEVHLSQCIIEKLMKLQKFKTDGLAYLGRQLLWQEQIIAASKGDALGMPKLQNEMPKNT